MIKVSKKLEVAINEQIMHEAENSFFYLSIYNWLQARSYKAAKFFKIQVEEEKVHMQKFIDYLLMKTNEVNVPVINLQKAGKDIEFKNLYQILQEAQKAEEETTKRINDLVKLAKEENEHSAFEFLQFFIKEQDEEMDWARNFLDKAIILGVTKDITNGITVSHLDEFVGSYR